MARDLAQATGRIAAHPAVWLVPASALLLALLPLPYGFYTLLRLVVCGAAIFLAYQHYEVRGEVGGWVVLFAIVALVFNPLIPLPLGRALWAPLDLGTAALFFLHWLLHRRQGA